MRNVTTVLLCGVVLLLLVGCQENRREYSETIHEDAAIAEIVYTPSRHDSKIDLTLIRTGPMGIGYSGNFGIRIGGGLQINDVTVQEKFAIVFKCQHGQFIVQNKEIYDKLKDHKGKTVDVTYREIYRTTYDTKNGKKQVTKRTLTGYDFLDATLK